MLATSKAYWWLDNAQGAEKSHNGVELLQTWASVHHLRLGGLVRVPDLFVPRFQLRRGQQISLGVVQRTHLQRRKRETS